MGLEKTLESPLDCNIRPVNPKGSPEYSLEGLILKLKLQYFGHLMLRADSLEKTDAGKDCRQEEKGATESGDGWMASSTLPTSLSKLRETGIGKPGVLQSMGWQRVGYD